MKNTIWEVIVGNIGCVYSGNARDEAERAFTEYRQQSENGSTARAAGEPVTLIKDGEPVDEYTPDTITK